MATVVVYKNRTNILNVNLGFDVSGDTLSSEIRESLSPTSPLIATWAVSFLTDGVDGRLVLRLDNSALAAITQKKGVMDMKRVSGGEPLPVFADPVQVTFKETVTA